MPRSLAAGIFIDLYTLHPEAKQSVAKSVGYAVFSNTGINLLLLSTGNGYGVAHDNETGKETYMRMFSAGVGIEAGVKDFLGIFIFSTQDVFDSFVEQGWHSRSPGGCRRQGRKKGRGRRFCHRRRPWRGIVTTDSKWFGLTGHHSGYQILEG